MHSTSKEIASNYKIIYPDYLIVQWYAFVLTIRRGRPIANGDAWIAATALGIGCPLLTHNAKDFIGIPGLVVVTEQNNDALRG